MIAVSYFKNCKPIHSADKMWGAQSLTLQKTCPG